MKAPQVPPYATRIPGRSAGEFKTHKTLAQAKQAILHYPHLRRDPDAGGYVFRRAMELMRLDPDQGEYLTWVKIEEGKYPEDYPELAKGYSDPQQKYLTTRAAAFLLGTRRSYVEALMRRGELTSVDVNGVTRLLRSEVEALKAGQEISAYYGGAPAPLPDGVAPADPEEAEAAQAWEKFDAAEQAGELVHSEPPESGIVACGTLPGLCRVDEGFDFGDNPAEVQRRSEELEEVPVTYVVAYNRREYLQWCAQTGEDPGRLDRVYVHNAAWLRSFLKEQSGYRYLVTPRAMDRRDFPEIQATLRADKAVRVNPDGSIYVHEEPELDEIDKEEVRAETVTLLREIDLPVEGDEGNERTREAVRRLEDVLAGRPKTLREIRSSLWGLLVQLKRIDETRQEQLPVLPAVYPLTVLAARYRGTYEGAPWVAFNDCPENLDGALGDDITCGTFFRTYERFKPIGRGATPEDAIRDLAEKLF